MQVHVNEFVDGQITAAYTCDSESLEHCEVTGRGGNAVLMVRGATAVVVSAPRSEGDVASALGAQHAPAVDLSPYFS